jgi:hypothetical protein
VRWRRLELEAYRDRAIADRDREQQEKAGG